MSVQIDNIFTASAKSVWEFLIEPGQGCYIPAYQRHYSWDKDNIDRLLEDVKSGVSQVLDRSEADRHDNISFLGTVIAIHDSSLRTVKPIYRTEVASKVMTIIDGQQRICTLVMLNIALHDAIRKIRDRIPRVNQDENLEWLADFSSQILVDLENTILIDRQSGDPRFRFYPRVIRSISDAWSRKQGQARYTSPIARLIWEYIDLIKTDGGNRKQFKYDPRNDSNERLSDHQALVDAFRFIQNSIKQIGQKSVSTEAADPVGMAKNDTFWLSLFKYPLPDFVKSYVETKSDDRLHGEIVALLRLAAFSRYLNYRVALTIVTTSNEDDAFDMFEALNTTGEPLTAFETFKPKVIDTEGQENYENSPSMKFIDQIEDYLKRFKKADEKQKATTSMLIPFALSETGHKIQKKLTDQRRYLRDEYERTLTDATQKREFVKSLAQLAIFMRLAWDVEKAQPVLKSQVVVDDEEALVGLSSLQKLKHSITIAPLLRFYKNALDAEDDTERTKRTEEFTAALKATVAFSMFWRGAMGGTENIDSHYREIMKNGIKIKDKQIPPLARRVPGAFLSLENYKQMLREVLASKGRIGDKESWVKIASQTPIYEHSKDVARFLLFAACDDSVPDPSDSGLLMRGRRGIAPMLTLGTWENETVLSVEHIAPQSKSAGWDQAIYGDAEQEYVHRLGNLTLLPRVENGMVGNKSWIHKKKIYEMLASESQDKLDQTKAEAKKIGFKLSTSAEEILKNAKYLGLCKAIAEQTPEWSQAFIEKRSIRLCELAWDRLSPWLS
jgi:hypothetical protein